MLGAIEKAFLDVFDKEERTQKQAGFWVTTLYLVGFLYVFIYRFFLKTNLITLLMVPFVMAIIGGFFYGYHIYVEPISFIEKNLNFRREFALILGLYGLSNFITYNIRTDEGRLLVKVFLVFILVWGFIGVLLTMRLSEFTESISQLPSFYLWICNFLAMALENGYDKVILFVNQL